MPEQTEPNEPTETDQVAKPKELTISTSATGGFVIGEEGEISIPETMLFQDWKSGLQAFKWARKSLQMSFAAYVAFGVKKYGKEEAHQCLEQMEFDMPFVSSALHINNVPYALRNPALSAEHLIILGKAELKKKEQKYWADAAILQKLTPHQLKVSIEAGEVVSGSDPDPTRGMVGVHGIRQHFDLWKKRVNGVEGVRAMSPAARTEIINELKDIAMFYQDLLEPIAETSQQ